MGERVRNEAVEIIVAWHCNLRCQSCAFASPAHPTVFADPDQVEADLTALAKWLDLEHVRVLGGEPLLHPRFAELLAAIRRSGIADKIRVVTNGVPLPRTSSDIWEAVDEMHISQYPNAKPFIDRHLADLTDKARSTGTELVVKHYDYFRVSFRLPDGDAATTQRVYDTCQMAHLWRSLTAEKGRLYRCLQSAYIQDQAGPSQRSRHGEDFLEIARIGSVAELDDWLQREEALKSCATCCGSVGRRHAHRQLPARTLDTFAGAEDIDTDYLDLLERQGAEDNMCVTEMSEAGRPGAAD